MKLTKDITLIPYSVEYYDLRDEKPRRVYPDTVILDGGRISALRRLGMKPQGYLARLYAEKGCSVCGVHKGQPYTVQIDLEQLWQQYAPAEQPQPAGQDKPEQQEDLV